MIKYIVEYFSFFVWVHLSHLGLLQMSVLTNTDSDCYCNNKRLV